MFVLSRVDQSSLKTSPPFGLQSSGFSGWANPEPFGGAWGQAGPAEALPHDTLAEGTARVNLELLV